jgi:hypothetical protein
MLSGFAVQCHRGNLMFSLNGTANTTICSRDFRARRKKLRMMKVMAGIVHPSLDVVAVAATLVNPAPMLPW